MSNFNGTPVYAPLGFVGPMSGTSEVLTAPGAISTTAAETALNFASGGAVTLAAPTAKGLVKVISVGAYTANYTLSLANVIEGTAVTTATFTAITGRLVLVSNVSLGKWIVIKQSAAGLTLS